MAIVVVIVVVIVMVVVLPGVLTMPFATALIMPMNPSMMVPPRPGYPNPFVAIVPIGRAVVIRPITQIDRDPDRHGAWPDKHASRQESHCKNRKFRFHSRYKSFARGRFFSPIIRVLKKQLVKIS
jgi:hypothetical protein